MYRKHHHGLPAGSLLIPGLLRVLMWGLPVSTALAEHWVERTELSGFFSTRYSQTDEAAFFDGDRTIGINEDGSFEGTKLGLNIRSQINDRMAVATQFFSTFEEDNYATRLDWAFASFDLGETTTLRAGKIKYPVGIVNEYVDVGVAYPWIHAPYVIYSESAFGPQATREAYTGASLLWRRDLDDWHIDSDLFWGQVNLEQMRIKGLLGLTVRGEWNETVQLQASYYSGEMKADSVTSPMNNRKHQAALAGVKVDWRNVIAYAEYADVDMDALDSMMMPTMSRDMDSESWYTTFGYRIGRWLPHLTFQDWERGNGYGHEITTLGLNYALSPRTVIKLEYSEIDSAKFATAEPLFTMMSGKSVVGLFDVADDPLNDGSAALYSVAVDVIF